MVWQLTTKCYPFPLLNFLVISVIQWLELVLCVSSITPGSAKNVPDTNVYRHISVREVTDTLFLQ